MLLGDEDNKATVLVHSVIYNSVGSWKKGSKYHFRFFTTSSCNYRNMPLICGNGQTPPCCGCVRTCVCVLSQQDHTDLFTPTHSPYLPLPPPPSPSLPLPSPLPSPSPATSVKKQKQIYSILFCKIKSFLI